MSAPETGYVVVSWWGGRSSTTAGSYEYEWHADIRDAFDVYDEYQRGEYARAREVGIFEARNGLPTGRLLHPAIPTHAPAEEMAERLRAAAKAGIEHDRAPS